MVGDSPGALTVQPAVQLFLALSGTARSPEGAPHCQVKMCAPTCLEVAVVAAAYCLPSACLLLLLLGTPNHPGCRYRSALMQA